MERKEKDSHHFQFIVLTKSKNHEHCHLTIEAIFLSNYHILCTCII